MASPYISLRAYTGYWGTSILLSYNWTIKVRAEKKRNDLSRQGIVNNAFIWMLSHIVYFHLQKALMLQILQDDLMNLAL